MWKEIKEDCDYPEAGKLVLVTRQCSNHCEVEVAKIWIDSEGEKHFVSPQFRPERDCYLYDNVTAWRDFPKPFERSK